MSNPRVFLFLWSGLWAVALPFVIGYLFYRGWAEADYRRWLGERFGFYSGVSHGVFKHKKTVWIHAVSMGEVRSATALITDFLTTGNRVVITHFTPAGRRTTQSLFPDAVANGTVVCLYIPFEFAWIYRRFFRTFQPQFGLVMEIEIWPRMIASARTANVPLFMCNAQYPQKSFARDKHGLRGKIAAGFAGYLVKSETQATRFAALGAKNIAITGELRFDQPIPATLIKAADNARINRPTLCIASAVLGEDSLYLQAIKTLQARADKNGAPRPLIIYVPRAPQRFAEVADMLKQAGQTVLLRSKVFNKTLVAKNKNALNTADILLGDSLNEMYFYLALSNAVVVGGGFTPKGAHNIIEPLALKKPVFVGPQIWTIEYPAEEAIAAGVLLTAQNAEDLTDKIWNALYSKTAQNGFAKRADMFYKTHAGATRRTLDALPNLIARNTAK